MAIRTNTQVILRYNLRWPNGSPIDLRRQTGVRFTLVMPDDSTATITDIGYDQLLNQIWVRIAGTHNVAEGAYRGNLSVMTSNLQMVTTGVKKLYDIAENGDDYHGVVLTLSVSSVDTPVNMGQGYSPKIVNGEWYVFDDSQQSYVPTGVVIVSQASIDSAVNAEKALREQSDAALQSAIGAEATRAAGKEQELGETLDKVYKSVHIDADFEYDKKTTFATLNTNSNSVLIRIDDISFVGNGNISIQVGHSQSNATYISIPPVIGLYLISEQQDVVSYSVIIAANSASQDGHLKCTVFDGESDYTVLAKDLNSLKADTTGAAQVISATLSKNISVTEGYYLTSSNGLVANADCRVSNIINAVAGDTFDVSLKYAYSVCAMVELDEYMHVLSYTGNGGTVGIAWDKHSVVISNSATRYVRFSSVGRPLAILYRGNSGVDIAKGTDVNSIKAELNSCIKIGGGVDAAIDIEWTEYETAIPTGWGASSSANVYRSQVIQCAPGDKFRLNLTNGGANIPTILVYTADNVLIATRTSTNYSLEQFEYTVPANAQYIILQDYREGSPSPQWSATKLASYTEEDVFGKRAGASPLYKKKWVSCGDSFTRGDFKGILDDEYKFIADGKYAGQNAVYPYIIGNRNDMDVVNEAINGSVMPLSKAYVDDPMTPIGNKSPFSYQRYKAIPLDADYITLWFGINDSSNTYLGEINDNTNTTFYGAWNVVLDYLLTNYPCAKIGIIVTNYGNSSYRQAIRDIAKKWGIPTLDMMGDAHIPVIFGREASLELDTRAKEIRLATFSCSAFVRCKVANSDSSAPTSEKWDNLFWLAGKSYSVGDIAVYKGLSYECTTANSDSTFTSEKWICLVWLAGESYSVGDIVLRNNNAYECTTANSDSTFTSEKWKNINWAGGTNYAVGDLAFYVNFHPNKYAHEYQSYFIENFLKSL